MITLCAYRDVSGMFTTENKVSCSSKDDATSRSQSEAETVYQDIRYERPSPPNESAQSAAKHRRNDGAGVVIVFVQQHG